MSGCVDPLLQHDEDFECFTDFFMALKPGTMDSTEESTDTTFARHLRNTVLPQFSDEEVYMDRFNTDDLIRSEIRDKSCKLIIDRFEDKPKDANMAIHVEHFSLQLKSQILKAKIKEYHRDEKISGHAFTDLELAQMLNSIVNKYDYAIDDYISIKFMVDSQFETTKKFFMIQAFIYIVFFFVPLMAQIFILDNHPNWVIKCNQSCLVTTVLFLGIEFIQLEFNGFANYISDRDNQIDCLTLVTFLYYYTLRLENQESPLIDITIAHQMEQGPL